MPSEPEKALGKATGISQGTSLAGDALQAVIEALAGAMGVAGIPAPGAGTIDSRASRFGELLSAAAPLAAVKGARTAVKTPIKAYHGSPHDFERFDLSKIGTGEGMQGYGHGLYFAEAEQTARSYRDNLAPPVPTVRGVEAPVTVRTGGVGVVGQPSVSVGTKRGGEQVRESLQFTPEEKDALAHLGGSVDESIQALREQAAQSWRSPGARQLWMRRADILERLKPEISFAPGHGRMYEVNIHADPDSLLDWDKPLSQQPKPVQDALLKTGNPVIQRWRDNGAWEHATGRMAYDTLSQGAAGTNGALASGKTAVASERMKDAGVPGLRYLDQGSRTAGEGSRNYVIFDDALIEILRKYGLLPAAAGAGGAAMYDPNRSLFDE